MTFCRSVYVKKLMKLLAFIFEQPSYTQKKPCFSKDQIDFSNLVRGSTKDQIILNSVSSSFTKILLKCFTFGCYGNQNSENNGNLLASLKADHPMIIPLKFSEIPPSGLG